MNTTAPTSAFGPVTIASIPDVSADATTVPVRLQQKVITTYPPGSRPQFELQDALTSGRATIIHGVRKATQRFGRAEAAALVEGQQVPGTLYRTLTDRPRYAGQKQAYEGGYASSTWSAEAHADIDLRSVLQEA